MRYAALRQAGAYTYGLLAAGPVGKTHKHGGRVVPAAHRYGAGGLGVLGSKITAANAAGTVVGPLINDGLISNSEYIWRITVWPVSGMLVPTELGQFTYTAAASGAFSFDYVLYEDGQPATLGTTVTMLSGAAPITLAAAACTQINTCSTGAIALGAAPVTLIAAASAQPNTCSTGVVSIGPAPVSLIAAACNQRNTCSTGAIVLGAAPVTLIAAASAQPNTCSTGVIALGPAPITIFAAACSQANSCSTGAVTLIIPAVTLLAAACTQANTCTAGAALLVAPRVLGDGQYCTLANLVARYGDIELVQLTNPTDPAAVTVAALRVDDEAADIDALINAKLAARYTLPLASVPRVLRNIACDLVRARLYEDRITDRVAERERAALKLLDQIAKGDVSLGLDDAAQPTPSSDGPTFTTPARVFSRDRLRDYAP